MSNPPCQTAPMNMKKNMGSRLKSAFLTSTAGQQVIARFGEARLVRSANGRHELVGGTAADCAEAQEWCAIFAPEVVFSAARRGFRGLILAA
jgi:hypothetical protein